MRYLKIMIMVLFMLGSSTHFLQSVPEDNFTSAQFPNNDEIPSLDYEFEPEDAERLFAQLPDSEISPLRQWLTEKGASIFVAYLSCKKYTRQGYDHITDLIQSILTRAYPW